MQYSVNNIHSTKSFNLSMITHYLHFRHRYTLDSPPHHKINFLRDGGECWSTPGAGCADGITRPDKDRHSRIRGRPSADHGERDVRGSLWSGDAAGVGLQEQLLDPSSLQRLHHQQSLRPRSALLRGGRVRDPDPQRDPSGPETLGSHTQPL